VAAVAILALAGCSPSLSVDFRVDCGPIPDAVLCREAVDVAATAKLNPPPIVRASIRRPRADDPCATALHPCGPEAVIVTMQSGDTLQDVALVPSGDGWMRHDLIR